MVFSALYGASAYGNMQYGVRSAFTFADRICESTSALDMLGTTLRVPEILFAVEEEARSGAVIAITQTIPVAEENRSGSITSQRTFTS